MISSIRSSAFLRRLLESPSAPPNALLIPVSNFPVNPVALFIASLLSRCIANSLLDASKFSLDLVKATSCCAWDVSILEAAIEFLLWRLSSSLSIVPFAFKESAIF